MSQRGIDTGSDHVAARVEDRVALITLNRPEARNALSGPMLRGLALALDDADRASDVGAVVLTGAGKAFCAGGDVKGMNARNQEAKAGAGPGTLDAAILRQRLDQRATAGRIYSMSKPVIGSLPGAAAGAGLALALACDLRIAAESAFLLTAFARVGFSGDFGGTYFMTQLIGSARARELYYLSDRVDASEALRLGLVNKVVPDETLEPQTFELAARIAHGPTIAYQYMKENLNRASGGEVFECMDLEATHHIHTGLTEDHRNAVRAFVEKRKPEFNAR
ncbi:MAG: enoyl-CoA hydratase [Myxococcota bacterium]|nr:enoyl-CoA hydratase [Myxococcota bacterium]